MQIKLAARPCVLHFHTRPHLTTADPLLVLNYFRKMSDGDAGCCLLGRIYGPDSFGSYGWYLVSRLADNIPATAALMGTEPTVAEACKALMSVVLTCLANTEYREDTDRIALSHQYLYPIYGSLPECVRKQLGVRG